MCTLYDPLNIANNFIERGIRDNIPVTPMKLQKLMYFLYRDYLQKTGYPLFSERFEAWQYGPVISCVYQEFKNYKANSIKKYATDKNGNAYKVNDSKDSDFSRTLDAVWVKYKRFTGIELSRFTHQEGTAWHKAWMNNQIFLNDIDIKEEKAA